jgi:hypothetical protein
MAFGTHNRDAQQGGAVVVDAADGIEVVGDRVAGVGLDDEPGAVGGKRLTDVAGGSERVAHVMQAVERRGEVVTGAGKLAGLGDLEAHPAGDPGVGGPLAGDLNRPVVIVRAGEGRIRVLTGEQDRRCAEPAADVGDPGAGAELAVHSVQRRDPRCHQVGDVAGPEEQFTAAEDIVVMFVPAHPGAGAERVGDARLGLEGAEREHERAGGVDAAVRVGQRERLLLGH